MSDPEEAEEVDDPWLTVAEIADELRVNPATVRLWVSKGALPAKRAGQRKLLIRRSDLDHMLEVTRGDPPATGYQPRPRDPRSGCAWSPATSSVVRIAISGSTKQSCRQPAIATEQAHLGPIRRRR